MTESHRLPLQASSVIIHLLRGVVYSDTHPKQWQNLITFQSGIRGYLSTIGLEVVLDESEGYAFLRQNPEAEASGEIEELPRLIQRRPLSFQVSLLCVLVRRKLAEQDAAGGETRVILSRDQTIEMLRVFLRDSSNEARIIDQIDTYLSRLVDFGFLRKLKSDEALYEIRRVVKAMVDAQWLGEMSEKLEAYRRHARDAI